MDQCTHEVRLQYWKNIISQCQARPEGQTAKQWMNENGICEQTYYAWQRKIRQSAYELMQTASQTLPNSIKQEEITFAEVSLPVNHNCQDVSSFDTSITPVAVIKTENCSIALSADVPEILLARILREVSHA